jgi:cellulose 1,4-beta-cellobiosidase
VGIGFNGSYTGANAAPTTFTLCAAADADTTNGTRTFTIAGAGVTSATLTATELDSPPVGPIVVPSILVPEGGSASVTLRLSAQPTANLTFTSSAGPGDPDLTLCGGAVIVVTPANWNVPQTITICAAEDPDTLNGTRTSSSPARA